MCLCEAAASDIGDEQLVLEQLEPSFRRGARPPTILNTHPKSFLDFSMLISLSRASRVMVG